MKNNNSLLVETVSILSKQMLKENKNWRKGQAVFNALHTLYPDIADSIRTTKYDPFHDDNIVKDLYNYLNGLIKQ